MPNLLRRLSVLLVEGDEEIREHIAGAIRPMVRKLFVAEDGKAGLSLFRQMHPDIVVTAMELSGMDGLQMCRAIRESDRAAHIIFSATDRETARFTEALDAGVHQFVQKPFDAETFVGVLRRSPLQLLLAEAVERQKSITRAILDAQDPMVVVTDGERILEANNSFFDFFGPESPAAVKNGSFTLADRIVAKPGFVGSAGEETWLMQLLAQPGTPRKVLLQPHLPTGDPAVFLATVKPFSSEPPLYVVSLTDVSSMEAESRHFERLATVDPLTGVFNRIKLVEALHQELARLSRYGGTFSVVLFDIDHFKHVNDTHGHQTGDRVLVGLAQLVQSIVRVTDVFARWGGEEFIVLAPETDLAGARDLAEHLRVTIGSFDFPEVGNVTCSFGVAEMEAGRDIDFLLTEADGNLYEAKRAGRNCVRAGREH